MGFPLLGRQVARRGTSYHVCHFQSPATSGLSGGLYGKLSSWLNPGGDFIGWQLNWHNSNDLLLQFL